MELKEESLLIPQDVENTIYKGFIIIGEREYNISLVLKSSNNFEDAQFSCSGELYQVLQCYKDTLLAKLRKCASVLEFLTELQMAVETVRGISSQNDDNWWFQPEYMEAIYENLETIGWGNVLSVNKKLSELQLTFTDSVEHKHVLGITLDPRYPSARPYCVTDTPLPLALKWPTKDSDFLKNVYEQFVNHIKSFKELWDILDEIDTNCWVLEPSRPLKSSTFRRIVVNANSSLLVSLNVRKPSTFPECKFFGPEYSINPLKEKLFVGLHQWNEKETVLHNLENILEIKFPLKEDNDMEEFSLDCGICYSYDLDTEVPEKTCEQPKCGKVYHNSCLSEWLRTLPNCKQSFNILFGECPHCSATLTIKLT